MSNKILGNEIFSNDGRENIHAATLNAVTPESGMSLRRLGNSTCWEAASMFSLMVMFASRSHWGLRRRRLLTRKPIRHWISASNPANSSRERSSEPTCKSSRVLPSRSRSAAHPFGRFTCLTSKANSGSGCPRGRTRSPCWTQNRSASTRCVVSLVMPLNPQRSL